MIATLLILHFFGLSLAVGTGMAGGMAGRMLSPATPDAGRLRLALRNASATGLALLWISGALLVWSKYDGVGTLPVAFWIKLAAVVALTITFGITFAESRRPGPPKLAPKLGPATGVLALLAIIFAVVAFE